MKRFIYMDTQKMASYLAQANGGHDIGRKIEVSDSTSSTVCEPADSVTGSLSGGVSAIFAKSDLTVSGTLHGLETAFVETQSGKEIVEKAVHDSIYNQMLDKLTEDGVILDEPSIGRYWCGSNNLKYMDLGWLLRMTGAFDELQKSNFLLTRQEGQRNGKYPKFKKTMPENTEQIFAMIDACFPSNVVVMNNCVVSFLRRECIRENPQSIYLFRRDMYMLGYCMRKYEPFIGNGELYDVFYEMTDKALQALENFGLKTEDLTIIDPIAIYYDEESL